MMNDDDRPRPKPALLVKPVLDNLSVAEDEAYIATLEEEILRVRADIKKKQASREAADSFFKK